VSAPVRVAVCEDSRTFAFALRRFLEREGELEVVGVYRTAEALLEALPNLRADLVTMDLELPGMDGVSATTEIMRSRPLPIVVVSDHAGRASERAAAALAAGAVDALHKSRFRLDEPDEARSVALRRRLGRLSRTAPRRRTSRAPGPQAPSKRLAAGRRAASLVTIAASTGGPAALVTVLETLPATYPVPLLVVQHMSPGFTEGLVAWLDKQIPLPVRLALAGASLGRGVVVAPDGAHLVIEPSLRLALDRDTPAGPHRPAADVLMRSAAQTAGRGAVGIVLTGMGRDGAQGIAAIRVAGGLTIAQDEGTSVVYGMPRAAAQQGAELILPLAGISAALGSLRHARSASS
jgi:two-component system chemotaxis response regulator CheB